MNHFTAKKIVLTGLLLLALAACGPVTPAPTPVVTAVPKLDLTETVLPMGIRSSGNDNSPPMGVVHIGTPVEPTPSPVPWDGSIIESLCMGTNRTCLRWFIGLGTGAYPAQLAVEQVVANNFNANDKIRLVLEPVPYAAARDGIKTEIAADNGPDIIGPISWQGAAFLHGQLKDLKSLIAAQPELTKDFNPALLESYKTSEGQVSLPFAVYPSAIFYNTALFDKAGLAYPPSSYGPGLSPAIYRLDGRDVEWNWNTVREVARRLTLDAANRNATQPGFDKSKIVQYGFTWGHENQPSYLGTFWGNGAYTAADGKTAQLPAAWKDAWAWTYDGTWGDQPFIPNGEASRSADFDKGNPFNSGKVAMTDQPSWYTCCMVSLQTWDIGVLPAYDGKVAGRVDADFFGIWKGTQHVDEAFQALAYLTTTGVQKLIIGSPDLPAAYNAVPARARDQDDWLNARKKQFPWVRHWDVLITNLSFPDSPSAEAYMPNYTKAWDRSQHFYDLLSNTGGLNLAQEEATFLADLQAIFNEN